MTVLIKIMTPSHKYPCCYPVGRNKKILVTTTRNIPWVEHVFATLRFGRLQQIWRATVGYDRLETSKKETEFKSQVQTGTTTNRIVFRRRATTSRCRQYHSRTEGASRKQRTYFAAKQTFNSRAFAADDYHGGHL